MNKINQFLYIHLFICYLFSISNSYCQTWTPVGGGTEGYIQCFGEYNGNLIVAGGGHIGFTSNAVGGWNGMSWFPFSNGTSTGGIKAITVYNSELIVAGDFFNMDNKINTKKIAAWDGFQWHNLGLGGGTGIVYALAVYNGELYVGGNFISIGGIPCNRIAKWNGTQWSDVGGGIHASIPSVQSMAVYNGELYIGGQITQAGIIPCNNVARWNGFSWDSVSSGIGGYVFDMLVDTVQNKLIFAGTFLYSDTLLLNNIATWNGNKIEPIGNGLRRATHSLAFYRNRLYTTQSSITGRTSDSTMAYWDGINWTYIQGFSGPVYSLMTYDDELYVGGEYDSTNYLPNAFISKMYLPPLTIEEFNEKNGCLDLFPNPSTETTAIVFNFKNNINDKLTLKIYDNLGRIVFKKEFKDSTNTYILKDRILDKGVYIAVIQNKNERISRKFVIN